MSDIVGVCIHIGISQHIHYLTIFSLLELVEMSISGVAERRLMSCDSLATLFYILFLHFVLVIFAKINILSISFIFLY